MKNDFDRIAWIYDSLARLVFGKSITEAQTAFLEEIPENADVLIVGGGTGWILKALDELDKSINVVFVDLSAKMVNKAKQRAPFKNLEVTFNAGSYEHVYGLYDVIITNFFLDVFDEKTVPNVIKTLRFRLKAGGYWLITDFVKGAGWWQDILISIMYRFFRITTKLEGKRLLNFDVWLKKNGLSEAISRKFHHGMIKSSIYKPS